MATLSGNKIKNTYQSLVKFSDNGNITTSAKQLTDGFGNNSPMFVSTTQVGIGVTPESGLNLHVFGDAKIGSNLTVIGNLVVEGSTTTVGTDTLTVKDPLIVLANNNTSTDAVDIGFYGKYHPSDTTLYSGLFREALTGKYRLFKGLEVEPTTTVNTSGTGYAKADLVIGELEATTGRFSGYVNIDGVLDVDDTISVEGSAFGRIEIGGASGGYIDLKAPNSDDYDFRIITSSGGNEITTATGDLIFNTAETLALTIDTSQDATFEGNIIVSGTVDGRDVATDGAKLDGIEASADVTDATNVLAAGAVMTTGNQSIAGEKTFSNDTTFSGNLNIGDNEKILFGDSGDVEMFFNGSTFVIDDTVEVFGFDIDTNLIRFRGTDLYTEISNGQHTFWTNGTERFKINATEVKVSHQLNVTGDLKVDTDTLFVDVSTDSVGINTSNPSDYRMDELVVTVPDEGGITIASATDEAAYLAFADITGTNLPLHYLRVDHSLNKFEFHSEESFSFQVLEGVEALGISDTSVDIRESTTIHDSLTVEGNSTFEGQIIASSSSSGDYVRMYGSSGTGQWDIYGNGENLRISENSGGGGVLAVDSGATFGGSINAGVSTFNSDSGGTALKLIGRSAANSGTLRYYQNNGTTQTARIESNDSIFEINSISNLPIQLKTNDTLALTIDTSQNSTFTGSVTANAYLMSNGSLTNGSFWGAILSAGTGSYADFALLDSGTTRIMHVPTGTRNVVFESSVGIGETSPSATLNIKSLNSTNSDSLSDVITKSEFKLQYRADDLSSMYFGGLGSERGYLQSINNAENDGSSFCLNPYGGNVGIGETSPQQLLHINNPSGNFSAEAVIRGSTSTGTPKAEVAFKRASSGDGATLVLRSSNSSGTIADAVTIDTSQNVGIDENPAYRLDVNDEITGAYTTSNPQFVTRIKNKTNDGQINSSFLSLQCSSDNGGSNPVAGIGVVMESTGSNNGSFVVTTRNNSGNTEKLRIDSSGNVTISGYTDTISTYGSAYNQQIYNAPSFSQGVWQVAGVAKALVGAGSTGMIINTAGNATAPIIFSTGSSTTERMRITSGGDVEITGGYASSSTFQSTGALRVLSNSNATTGNVALELMNDATSNRFLATFSNLNGIVGSISTNASATSYNTSSDYRLKEDLQDFAGLDMVSKIPVYDFKWKTDESRSYGVMAHELQEVLPQAVVGEKDAEEMQSVDYSKIVPLLVKSIQELKAEVEQLKTQINN